MKANEIILIYCNGWEGIYIDGKLEIEGVSLSASILIDVIDTYKSFKVVKELEIEEGWMDKEGELPLFFESIPKEYLYE